MACNFCKRWLHTLPASRSCWVAQRLALFGEQGRAVYFNILMGDLIYAGLFGGFLGVSITLLFRRLDFPGQCWQYAGLLPLATMAFDYLEDGLILSLLKSYPTELPLAASAAGFATLTKSIFGSLSFLMLAVGLVALLVRRFRTQHA